MWWIEAPVIDMDACRSDVMHAEGAKTTGAG